MNYYFEKDSTKWKLISIKEKARNTLSIHTFYIYLIILAQLSIIRIIKWIESKKLDFNLFKLRKFCIKHHKNCLLIVLLKLISSMQQLSSILKWFNTIYRQHACLAIIESCRRELWECVILYLCAFGTCWSICKCSNCVQTPWWFIFSPVMWIIFWSLHFLSWAAIASQATRGSECKNSHYIYW